LAAFYFGSARGSRPSKISPPEVHAAPGAGCTITRLAAQVRRFCGAL